WRAPPPLSMERSFGQLAVVGVLDIVGAHAFEYGAEQVELPVRICRRGLSRCANKDQARLNREQRQCCSRRRAEKNERRLAHHPRTFSPSPATHHGPGSTGTPSFLNSTYSTGWLEPVARIAAIWEPFPMSATGSPVSTNCPRSTDIRSIPASKT